MLDSAVLSDEFGDAVVVELENTSKETLVNVPILIDVRDKAGKSIFTNDTPGTRARLNHISVLQPGETADWVNDQILASGKPSSSRSRSAARGGGAGAGPRARGEPPRYTPRIPGVQVEGKVVNKSQIDQIELVLYAVARSGRQGGRRRPGPDQGAQARSQARLYNIFFIGNPRGARGRDVNAFPTTSSRAAWHGSGQDKQTVDIPTLGDRGRHLRECGAVLAIDQRYCVNCGAARGRAAARLHEAPRSGGVPPARRCGVARPPRGAVDRQWSPIMAVGAIGVLGVMLLLGVLIGKDDDPTTVAAATTTTTATTADDGGSGGTGSDGRSQGAPRARQLPPAMPRRSPGRLRLDRGNQHAAIRSRA